jgi:hypothetical protein
MPTGLTKLQKQLLSLIKQIESETWRPPGTKQLQELVWGTSRSPTQYSVWRSLNALKRRGLIMNSGPYYARSKGFRWTADPDRRAWYRGRWKQVGEAWERGVERRRRPKASVQRGGKGPG